MNSGKKQCTYSIEVCLRNLVPKKLIFLFVSLKYFRNVQSILKSPALDKRYEKFSISSGNQSPSSGRRKFLQGRSGAAKRRVRQKRSPSKGQPPVASSNLTATSPTRNGSSSNVSVTTGCSSMEMAGTGPPLGIIGHSLGSTDDQLDTPVQVTNKYNVGDIIGDGMKNESSFKCIIC